ncbi:cutinase family protein [Nocardia wallacei]|uniref:cutinase family protein n=1 Tax=Nocardia wallacei TaxID=480035 RepID=UPI0024543786|nr:cutinase family protein [Nocardia wallacei]
MTPTRPTIHRLAYALLCIVAVTALAVLGSGPATAAPASADPNCPRFTAVLVPGTGETTSAASGQPDGALAPIGQGLRQRYGTDIAIHTLTSTTTGSGASGTSESAGVQALSTALAGLCSSTQVVLAGYSHGATIAGNVATAIGHHRGPLPASRIVAVALLSDPRRAAGTPQLGPSSPGEGIAGPRGEDFGALTDRVRTLCATSDLTCATSPHAIPALTALGRAVTGNPIPPTGDTTAPGTDPTSAPPLSPPTGPSPGPAAGSLGGPEQAAAGSIAGLDPSEIVRQVVIVLSGLTSFAAGVPAIVSDLAQLPGLLATGNVPGLHQVSGDLNNRFAPLVQMAAQIDLHLVARALALAAPLDTSGWTAIASQIVAIIANLDIGRIATDIGQAQEIAWDAIHKLATGDPAGAALALTGLLPIAGDLATTAASALIGDAGTYVSGLAHTFTDSTSPDTSNALADLARRGSDAARLAGPGVDRNGYSDDAGRQALNWLITRLDAAR